MRVASVDFDLRLTVRPSIVHGAPHWGLQIVFLDTPQQGKNWRGGVVGVGPPLENR